MSDYDTAVLGRTGVRVCRLGLSASYGVPAAGVERAIEAGVNYLYWGSRRTEAFAAALRNQRARRERFVLVVQSYSRVAGLLGWSLERALKKIGYDHADVLLLGMWNKGIPPRMVDAARGLKERGLVRWLAFSTHNRPAALDAAPESGFDIVHLRYNAVHPGAERDVFPKLAPAGARPGIVAFTATSWGQLTRRGVSAADCYRFVLSQPAVDVCMTGPKTAAHVADALEALRLGPLTEQELRRVRQVGDKIYGPRAK